MVASSYINAIPLSDLLLKVRRVPALNFSEPVWVKAEIAQINERKGHLYLTLVQNDMAAENLARVDAHCWSRSIREIIKRRGPEAREVLKAGQEICCQVEVDFHERFGLKLSILDVDPTFTIGQLELQFRQIVEKLRAEGLLDLNQRLTLPCVLQRIAVITSSNAAGWADFRKQLEHNSFDYAFDLSLFDVAVQGADTEPTVVWALEQIGLHAERFDAVCLLRGGGSKLDLADFNRYSIGAAIGKCPLPVLVGIGHETDSTLPDLAGHSSLKTPTALAEFLLKHNMTFEIEIVELGKQIARWSQQEIRNRQSLLDQQLHQITTWSKQSIREELQTVLRQEESLRKAILQAFAKTRDDLEAKSRELKALDPQRILERGYSISTFQGQILRSASQLQVGNQVRTRLAKGEFLSQVTETSIEE